LSLGAVEFARLGIAGGHVLRWGFAERLEQDLHGLFDLRVYAATVRALFVIDPAKKVPLLMYYPFNIDRSMEEIQPTMLALQLSDEHQVAMAKQILRTNCLVISQLVEILEEITFDEGQLELAKFAYDHIYDLENYWEVYGVFSFSSSTEELEEFIEFQY